MTEGERIATIALKLGGETVYAGALLAARDIEGRSVQSDTIYHLDRFIELAFSPMGAFVLVSGIVAILAALRIALVLRKLKQRRRNPYKFLKNHRRN